MPKIYKKNCDYCNSYYKSHAKQKHLDINVSKELNDEGKTKLKSILVKLAASAGGLIAVAAAAKLIRNIVKKYRAKKADITKDKEEEDKVSKEELDFILESLDSSKVGIIKQMAIDIFNIHTIIFKNFYQTFYESLQKNKKVNPFAIMFDENGLIATDGRDEDMPAVGNGPLTVGKKHYLA